MSPCRVAPPVASSCGIAARSGPRTGSRSGWSVLLLVVAIASDALAIETALRLSGSFIAIVLAMALLGPAPRRPARPRQVDPDVASAASLRRWPTSPLRDYPLVGGLIVRATEVRRGLASFGLVVFGVFAATNTLNFLLAPARRVTDRRPLMTPGATSSCR